MFTLHGIVCKFNQAFGLVLHQAAKANFKWAHNFSHSILCLSSQCLVTKDEDNNQKNAFCSVTPGSSLQLGPNDALTHSLLAFQRVATDLPFAICSELQLLCWRLYSSCMAAYRPSVEPHSLALCARRRS